jgi:hypothetical protein
MTFPLVKQVVDYVVTVSEDDLARAMKGLATEERLIVEGAGAAAVASILAGKASAAGRRVVAMVTGGNVDLPKWLTRDRLSSTVVRRQFDGRSSLVTIFAIVDHAGRSLAAVEFVHGRSLKRSFRASHVIRSGRLRSSASSPTVLPSSTRAD